MIRNFAVNRDELSLSGSESVSAFEIRICGHASRLKPHPVGPDTNLDTDTGPEKSFDLLCAGGQSQAIQARSTICRDATPYNPPHAQPALFTKLRSEGAQIGLMTGT